MKETGLMFKAPLVRAILDSHKTQTRRLVKPQPIDGQGMVNAAYCGHPNLWLRDGPCDKTDPAYEWRCPMGQPGDRIYVRETWMDMNGTGVEHRPDPRGPLQRYAYAADTPPGSYGDAARKDYGLKWKPSIHMPKAAARIWLEITGVRVERLQSISRADAIAEGIKFFNDDHECGSKNYMDKTDMDYSLCPTDSFETLWNSTGGDWAANPWVWVIDFKTISTTGRPA